MKRFVQLALELEQTVRTSRKVNAAVFLFPRSRRPRWCVGGSIAHRAATQKTRGQSKSSQAGPRTHWSAGLADGSLSFRSGGQLRNVGIALSKPIQDLRTFVGPNDPSSTSCPWGILMNQGSAPASWKHWINCPLPRSRCISRSFVVGFGWGSRRHW